MARAFIQANLPHRDPGDVPAWTRRNGDFLLQVVPGTTVGVTPIRRLGIPYGVYPRLILAFVTTEALRTRSPRIQLGCNHREAMERVGISERTGGARGTITRFKDQLARLARAEIAWSFVQGSRVLSAGIKPFEGMEAFWTAEASGPFVSQLVLNDRLLDEILRFSFPLDMRVVRTPARLGSSLAMDLYGWLTYRQFSLQRSGKPLLVPWGALERQLGGDYGRTRDFRRQVGAALTMIGAVYAGANATPAPRRLLVRPGGAHVRACTRELRSPVEATVPPALVGRPPVRSSAPSWPRT